MARLTRRKFLGVAASSVVAGPLRSLTARGREAAPARALPEFRVILPKRIQPLPEGVMRHTTAPGYKLRGIKGWAWLPEQYLNTIPVMAKYKMNFLMNCYTSLWNLEVQGNWARIPAHHVNNWFEPLPDGKKRAFVRVVRECQQHGMEFCFSMNPILSSGRPFDYESPTDFEALWRHYAWMQSLGVRWFNLSLDDIRQGINAGGQSTVANEIFRRLLTHNPRAQFIFTPTWYAGTGESGAETAARLGTGDTPGLRYIKLLAAKLHPDAYLYWTGPEVCALTIARQDAEAYAKLANHRLFIWDNYPCNDQKPTLHLGPLTGRDTKLAAFVEGYISNPLSPEDEANHVPMLTIADYLWNPDGYDPARSMGQAIAHLGRTQPQSEALKDLVELYPGRLVDHSLSTGWDSLRERFRLMLDKSPQQAANFIIHARDVSRRMARLFPDHFVLARRVLDADIETMRSEYFKFKRSS